MSVQPVFKATLQAAVINAGSNVLAQGIKAYRNDRPFEFDIQALIQFTLCAIITTPLNFIWQKSLEGTFPGLKSDGATTHEEKPGHSDQETSKPALNVTNTITKIIVDQTIGGTWNTVLFILTMGLLSGQRLEDLFTQIREEFWPIMSAGFKLWPFVSILNFTVVPVDQRLLVGSLFGVAWAVYLSLMSG